jgi:hypothetical protein
MFATAGAGGEGEVEVEVVRVIGLTRAQNVSIMLTTFSKFSGAEEVLAELCKPDSRLSNDNLLILVQAPPPSPLPIYHSLPGLGNKREICCQCIPNLWSPFLISKSSQTSMSGREKHA